MTELLSDIDQLESGSALKVPLAVLPDTKENIRSALNRATRHKGIEVATSSDQDFSYIWKIVQRPESDIRALSQWKAENQGDLRLQNHKDPEFCHVPN